MSLCGRGTRSRRRVSAGGGLPKHLARSRMTCLKQSVRHISLVVMSVRSGQRKALNVPVRSQAQVTLIGTIRTFTSLRARLESLATLSLRRRQPSDRTDKGELRRKVDAHRCDLSPTRRSPVKRSVRILVHGRENLLTNSTSPCPLVLSSSLPDCFPHLGGRPLP